MSAKGFGILFCIWSAAAIADVDVTVGIGTGCQYPTVQAAINGANAANGVTRIRVTRSQTYTAQAIDIDSKNVQLLGGYESCTDGTPDTVHTVLSGAGGTSRSIINIRGTTTNVALRGITLQGGHEQLDASSYGGAIDITQGPHQRIHLEDVLVTQNEAGVGGGISIRNGTPSQPSAVTVVLAANTSVNNNLGWTGGGGIYCRDATLLTESAPVSVILNRAGDLSDDNPSAYGGGLYLVNCRAEIAGGLFAVALNEASRAGGGIMASGRGTRVDLYNLSDTVPTQVYANTSHTYGGGLSIEDGADVYAWDVIIDENRAYQGGGAVALYSGDIDMNIDTTYFEASGRSLPARPASKRCGTWLDCNRIAANLASNPSNVLQVGAAFRLSSTAAGTFSGSSGECAVNLLGTRVADNEGIDLVRHSADQDFISNNNGWAYFSTDGALIDRNRMTSTLISAGDNGEYVNLVNTTVAGNSFSSPSGSVLLVKRAPFIRNSLLWQPGRDLFDSLEGTIAATNVRYNLLSDVGDIAISDPVQNIVSDPAFMDAANGDYRPSILSQALDFAPAYGTETRNGQQRVLDLSRTDQFGPQDAGAFEMSESSLVNLLRDGFE